jgi:hypothetical protein
VDAAVSAEHSDFPPLVADSADAHALVAIAAARGMAGGQLSRFLRSDVAALAALPAMAAAWRSRLVRRETLR